jgi:nitronate monooxygenase
LSEPVIIQGGMGAGISDWRLARYVSRMGQLGVVSGTALDTILIRRLQDGDKGGHMRRGLARFPIPAIAESILTKYYRSPGRSATTAYLPLPMYTLDPSVELLQVGVVGNFVEINLAKEGHGGVVGLNLLEKIQMHSLAALYGAMLAGADYVIVGAGIPRAIPAIIDRLTTHLDVSMAANADNVRAEDDVRVSLDPSKVLGQTLPPIARPKFIAIVASNVLALTLARKSTGRVDGFIIEGPTAGGHNAPPRGGMVLDENKEPLYGPKDAVDLEGIKKLGLPFWVAGGYGFPEKLQEALGHGANGVQVGTAFAFSNQSGMAPHVKKQTMIKAKAGTATVFTDPLASPTGFPFKVVGLEGTNSEADMYAARKRICNLAYLRTPYKKADGTMGYRCASEPIEQYLKKEGKIEDTVGRKCLCNGLMANMGLPQVYPNGYVELPLVTAGNDTVHIPKYLPPGKDSYTAGDVVRYLLGKRNKRKG